MPEKKDNPQGNIAQQLLDALARFRIAAQQQKATGNKPQPPASTGPVVGPPGGLRAETAARYGMSDQARRDMSRVPVGVVDTPGMGGGYYANNDSIVVNRESPADYKRGTLAHEFAHRQWFQNPRVSDDEAGYVKDVMKLANDPRYPNMGKALSNWSTDAQTDLYQGQYVPTELDARVVQFGDQGQQVPQWFRDKWGQNMYRNAPMGEGPTQNRMRGYQTPFGFVQEKQPPVQGPVYAPGWGRQNPWDTLMDSGFSMDQ